MKQIKHFERKYVLMVLMGALLFAMVAISGISVNAGQAVSVADTVFKLIATALITGISVVFLYKYIMDYLPDKRIRTTDFVFVSALTAIAVLSICLVGPYMPEAVASFWVLSIIAVLYDEKLAFIVSVVVAAFFYILVPDSPNLILMIIFGGIIQSHLAAKTTQRSLLSMMGIVVAAMNFALSASLEAIRMMAEDGEILWLSVLKSSGIIALNSFVSVMLLIGLLPIIERLTGNLTIFRLQELSNPNHPLLKKLMMEAPGTYHHSIMVGNLAEAAAEQIGANVSLVRVASYYHDIGKLKRPEYFIENITDENPHDLIEPEASKQIIMSHVKEGDELARKYKLPREIRDIIKQHHGNTLISYFYHKAISDELAPDNITEDDYRYGGKKPQTKEAAIVMFADCVEAAVRALPEKCQSKTKEIIKNIITDKVSDGQLDETDISLKDLKKIQKSFENVICGYYHERLEYPETNVLKNNQEK